MVVFTGQAEFKTGVPRGVWAHTAYDANILGISPDLKVHVREDILRETDGPMLEHELKGMAGRTIVVPWTVAQRPHQEFLAKNRNRRNLRV